VKFFEEFDAGMKVIENSTEAPTGLRSLKEFEKNAEQ